MADKSSHLSGHERSSRTSGAARGRNHARSGTGNGRSARRSDARTQQLLVLATTLSEALTQAEVAEVIVENGIHALGASAGLVALVSEDGRSLRTITARGVAAEDLAVLQEISLSTAMPLSDAVRTKSLVLVESVEERQRRYPDLRVPAHRPEVLVAVPLQLRSRAMGAIGFCFVTERTFDEEERAFLSALGHHCALALDRARLYDREKTARTEAEASHERLTLLADVSRALTGSAADARTMLSSIAEMVTHSFAECCGIVLWSSDGEALEPIASHHRDPVVQAALREVLANDSLPPQGMVASVARTGQHLLVGPDRLRRAREDLSPRQQAFLDRFGPRTLLIVPMMSHGAVVGTLVSARDRDPRPFSPSDEILLRELADRAAAAVDHARLYEAERQARSQAEAANRMKDDFLATISHELRTPLTAILGWAKLLRVKHAPDSMTRGLEVIERNAQAQARLIDDVLDVSRIMRGKVTLERRPVALAGVVRSALDVLGPVAEAKGLTVSCCGAEDVIVLGDAGRLQQVVSNLVSNALKFTPKGGRVSITIRRAEPSIELEVADTGQGIRPEFLPYLFDRFRQADSTTTRRHGGLGLGLAIVRDLVELHGGSVEARSQGEGLGASFVVRLPPAPARHGHSHARGGAVLLDAPPILSGIRVLVCDDEGDTRDLLAQALTLHGAEVRAVESGRTALSELGPFHPDVIVSDLGMPDMDGFALMREIRTRPRQEGGATPAAALSAYSRPEDARAALAAGFQEHVAKPVDPSRLVATIARLARPVKNGA